MPGTIQMVHCVEFANVVSKNRKWIRPSLSHVDMLKYSWSSCHGGQVIALSLVAIWKFSGPTMCLYIDAQDDILVRIIAPLCAFTLMCSSLPVSGHQQGPSLNNPNLCLHIFECHTKSMHHRPAQLVIYCLSFPTQPWQTSC